MSITWLAEREDPVHHRKSTLHVAWLSISQRIQRLSAVPFVTRAFLCSNVVAVRECLPVQRILQRAFAAVL